jgi:hypothetical protein
MSVVMTDYAMVHEEARGRATAHGGKVDGLVDELEHDFRGPSGVGHFRASLGGMATNTGRSRLATCLGMQFMGILTKSLFPREFAKSGEV